MTKPSLVIALLLLAYLLPTTTFGEDKKSKMSGKMHVASLDEVIEELRDLNEEVPRPMRLPTLDEIQRIELQLGISFHSDYRKFLLKASDVVYGAIEPATITEEKAHTYLPTIVKDAREVGVPETCLPICEDNGSFYCMNPSGQVFFWDHNGETEDKWPSLAAWIKQVWMEQS